MRERGDERDIYSKNMRTLLKLQGFLLASSCINTDASARGSGLKRQKGTVPSFGGDLDTARGPDGVSEEKLRFKNEKRE